MAGGDSRSQGSGLAVQGPRILLGAHRWHILGRPPSAHGMGVRLVSHPKSAKFWPKAEGM